MKTLATMQLRRGLSRVSSFHEFHETANQMRQCFMKHMKVKLMKFYWRAKKIQDVGDGVKRRFTNCPHL